MMERSLYIDGRMADLPDSVNFNIVFQIAEIGKFKIYGSGTSTIKLPLTPNNRRIFSNCEIVNVIADRVKVTFSSIVYYQDGIPLIQDGKGYLLAVSSDGYELSISFGNSPEYERISSLDIRTLEIAKMKWDESEMYHLAECSTNKDNYPTVRIDEETKLIHFNHALCRPVYYYSTILSKCGISSSNVPFDTWLGLAGLVLQPNADTTTGGDIIAGRLVDDALDNVVLHRGKTKTNIYYTNNSFRIEISVKTAGKYRIELKNMDFSYDSMYDNSPDPNLAAFISKRNDLRYFGFSGQEMRKYMILNDDKSAFIRPKLYQDGKLIDIEETDIIAFDAISLGESVLTLHATDDFSNNEIYLDEGIYYMHLIRNDFEGETLTFTYPSIMLYFAYNAGYSLTELGMTGTTAIDSPDNPVFMFNPPDLSTILGYESVTDVIEDFMKLTATMVQYRDGKMNYFGIKQVRENKSKAYDWSDGFEGVEEVQFGNSNLGLKNKLAFTSYDKYQGGRSDYVFDYPQAQSNDSVDLVRLKRIASYDNFNKNVEYKIGGDNSYMGSADIPTVPVFEVAEEKDEETGQTNYSVGGMKSIPNVMYRSSLNGINVKSEDGYKTYTLYPIDTSKDTYAYLVNAFWKEYLELLRHQRKLIIASVIPIMDLRGFDFSRPIYFRQLAVYMLAQKITYKGAGQVSKIEGIIV